MTTLLFAVLLSTVPVEKRAFEVRDVWGAPRVSAPVLSPDGSLAAYVLSHNDLESGESWSELWMLRTDGSQAPRQLTHGKGSCSSPLFSPDGARLLFLSERDAGQPALRRCRSTAARRSSSPTWPGALEPGVSPDGRWIAATADVFPECGADEDCNKERDEARAQGKTQGARRRRAALPPLDELARRPRTHGSCCRRGERGGRARPDARPLRQPDLLARRRARLRRSRRTAGSCASSRTTTPTQAESTNADLWVVPVEGGTERAAQPDGRERRLGRRAALLARRRAHRVHQPGDAGLRVGPAPARRSSTARAATCAT